MNIVLWVLAAVGLILPAAVGVLAVLVPLAAVGLILMMIGAALTHARRREFQAVGTNVVPRRRRCGPRRGTGHRAPGSASSTSPTPPTCWRPPGRPRHSIRTG